MMKSASTPAILVILVGGTLATLPVGCKVEQVPIGQLDTGGQTTSTVTGGAGSGTTSAGGAGGGSAQTGGIAAAGGVNASGGGVQAGGLAAAGGSTASGGNAKAGGIAAVGGANASGGVTGLGGSGAGGSTGCAPGWTMCCGQCLSPLAGVCAPCPATGGAKPAGGAPSTGGRGGSGAGGTGVGGSSGTGGTGAGGSSGVVCGGLRGMSCSTGQFCDLPPGSCSSADMTGTCVVKSPVCSALYQPVCGCDGRTYSSDCNRISAGVTKKSDGACAATDAGVCPAGESWCPGCPSQEIPGGCGQVCPAIACLAPDAGTSDAASGSCSAITTQAACDGRSDCHSVYVDPGTCGCAGAGCCAHFNRCVDGGRANCSGPVACTIATPFCEAPFVVSYANNCFEGCVRQTECAGVDAAVTTPTCPQTPPTNASSCGSTNLTCFYDNCPSTGRTQAVCAGGAWTVQTAACGTVSCSGFAAGQTCPSGKTCVVFQTGLPTANCLDNPCGQGPVTSLCSGTTAGCSVTATLTSGVTFTCDPCSQGGCQ